MGVEANTAKACTLTFFPYPLLCSFPRLVQVCAVCADGHTAGLGFACTACSGVRRKATIALGVVLLVAAAVMMVASLHFLGFLSSGIPTGLQASCGRFRRAASRLKCSKATQALKIVIVSWQIVTQASCSYSTTPTNAYRPVCIGAI